MRRYAHAALAIALAGALLTACTKHPTTPPQQVSAPTVTPAPAAGAVSPTPVVWKLAPGLSQVTFLGARVVAVESANTVAAFDATGAALWRLPGEGGIAKLVADDSGKLLAVVRDKSLDLVDATTGALLGTQPLRWEDHNGKGGPWTTWHGDMLYVGVDDWMTDHYSATRWYIYRTTERGLEELAFVGAATQGVQVSWDGQTAIIQQAGGRRDLYINGAENRTVAAVGDLVPGANLLYWNQDGHLFVHDFDRKKLVFSVDPVPGYTLWNPWPRPDGLWFVAGRPVDGGWIAYKEGEIAFAGDGGVSGYYANYLIVTQTGRCEVIDRTGAVVLNAPGEWLRLTPDEQWAYFQTNDRIQAYRLP